MRNLMLAECQGKISREGLWHNGNQRDWRESMLIEGVMWQHIRKMMRLELMAAREEIAKAKSSLAVECAALAKATAERDAMLAL
ncbi:hypothetical protein [Salmonella enterica]|uniref:hypothetical protein n=1 Tax=Salmonella enterica TaxID=28901 RepID=UPI0015D08505|nr:hypothetical protein [Salmonella enterica]